MIKTLLTLILLCGAAHAQPGVASMMLASKAVSGSAPTLIAHTCQNLGTNGGTTSPIDTTGANFIVVVSSYGGTAISGPVTLAISDNKSNGAPTALTPYVNTISGIQIAYWTNPTVGTGHTFTASEMAVNTFNSICIEAWSGMVTSSVFDSGTDSGTGTPTGASPCSPGSITPSAGKRVVITGVTTDVTVVSINGSFSIDDHVADAGAGGWGDAVGSLYQSNGATTNPAWTITGSSRDACAIAAFKGA